MAAELEGELLGELPIDVRVAVGGETGVPIVIGIPDSEHARIFRDTAAKVALQAARLSGTGPRRSNRLRTV